MLKIYIQIFGTIALVAIILVNYNIFFKTPREDAIAEKEKKVTQIQGQIATMDSIIAFEPAMGLVETAVDKDYETIRLDLPSSYSVPDRIKRIYDLVLAADLQYKGIPAQAVLYAKPTAKLNDFVPNVSDQKELTASIAAFKKGMEPLKSIESATRFNNLESPIDRLQFYQEMRGQWNPASAGLARGLERHRYSLQLTGTYSNIKKFLWMVQNDKPLMQPTAVRIAPGPGVGETRPFNLSVTIIAYVDRNEFYESFNGDPTLLFGGAK